jgi:carbon monoxide dehydrogenase subunit G
MDLSHEFDVPLSIDEAWAVLTDLERVAPCMPGAQLDEIEGDEYRGKVKVKVGPVTVEYKGAATFLERVPETHTAVLRAAGRETKGQGNAAATVTATLVSAGEEKTHVTVLMALDISGRVAQFGRGALADVSSKILGQFVDNLEKDLAAGTKTAAAKPSKTASAERAVTSDGAVTSEEDAKNVAEESAGEATPRVGTAESGGIRKIDSGPVEPVSLGGMVSLPLLKRLGPIVAIVIIVALIIRARRGARA